MRTACQHDWTLYDIRLSCGTYRSLCLTCCVMVEWSAVRWQAPVEKKKPVVSKRRKAA